MYNFCSLSNCADGEMPRAGLILDQAGNLYGTTTAGGTGVCGGCGTVFQLAPDGNGGWTESRTLYSFTGGSDGGTPFAGLIFDEMGNLYGTTIDGGLNYGTVFQLTPNGNGVWTENTLYQFTGGSDGGNSVAGLTFDAAGNLYGTTRG